MVFQLKQKTHLSLRDKQPGFYLESILCSWLKEPDVCNSYVFLRKSLLEYHGTRVPEKFSTQLDR